MSEIKPALNGDEATYSPPAHEMSFSIRAPAGRTIKSMTFRRTADGGITVVCQTQPAGEFTREDVKMLRSAVDWPDDDEPLFDFADRIEALLPPEEA